MITIQDITKGFSAGLVKLVVDPNMESGTVCQIGDCWFYFGGLTAEESSPEEYLCRVPMDDIIREIFETLEDFRKVECFGEEYEYYEAIISSTQRETKNFSIERK